MAQKFSTIQTQDTTINRLQQNVSNALNNVSGPFLDGNLVTGVTLSSTAKSVAHGLGRQPTIWVVCDLDSNATIHRTAWDDANVTLVASGNCTASLWFG